MYTRKTKRMTATADSARCLQLSSRVDFGFTKEQAKPAHEDIYIQAYWCHVNCSFVICIITIQKCIWSCYIQQSECNLSPYGCWKNPWSLTSNNPRVRMLQVILTVSLTIFAQAEVSEKELRELMLKTQKDSIKVSSKHHECLSINPCGIGARKHANAHMVLCQLRIY